MQSETYSTALEKRLGRGMYEPRLLMTAYSSEQMEIWKVWKMTTIFSLGPTLGKPHTKRRQMGTSIFVSKWSKWPCYKGGWEEYLFANLSKISRKRLSMHRDDEAWPWTITADILLTNQANSHITLTFTYSPLLRFRLLFPPFLRKLHKKMRFYF